MNIDFKDIFNIELLSKEEALSMYDVDFQHVMLIIGVHTENGKVIRWKIEDSLVIRFIKMAII